MRYNDCGETQNAINDAIKSGSEAFQQGMSVLQRLLSIVPVAPPVADEAKASTPAWLVPGAIVQIRSGGPLMTVAELNAPYPPDPVTTVEDFVSDLDSGSPRGVRVAWMTEKCELRFCVLPAAILRPWSELVPPVAPPS